MPARTSRTANGHARTIVLLGVISPPIEKRLRRANTQFLIECAGRSRFDDNRRLRLRLNLRIKRNLNIRFDSLRTQEPSLHRVKVRRQREALRRQRLFKANSLLSINLCFLSRSFLISLKCGKLFGQLSVGLLLLNESLKQFRINFTRLLNDRLAGLNEKIRRIHHVTQTLVGHVRREHTTSHHLRDTCRIREHGTDSSVLEDLGKIATLCHRGTGFNDTASCHVCKRTCLGRTQLSKARCSRQCPNAAHSIACLRDTRPEKHSLRRKITKLYSARITHRTSLLGQQYIIRIDGVLEHLT